MDAGISKYTPTVVWNRGAVAAVQAFGVALVAWCGFLPTARAQEAPQDATAAKTDEKQVTIRKESNLVMVRVVVRDAQGKPVEGLKQNDFQVLDDKKLQMISYFSVEDAAAGGVGAKGERTGKGAAEAREQAAMPQRYAALFFDDYHLEFADLVQVREAARRYLAKNLDRGARAAVFSASGNVHSDFTSDRDKLDQVLSQLQLEPRFQQINECPNLTGYEAQLIDDGLDSDALAVGIAMTVACRCNNDPRCPDAESYTKTKARQIVMNNDNAAANTLGAVESLVRRMAETPGERTIALVSDGFLNKNKQYLMEGLIDRALRANVIINAMDARGLYTTTTVSGRPVVVPDNLQSKLSDMRLTGMSMNADVLSYVAEGTGGTFVQNSNDFEGGFRKIASLREITYVMGFSPENLKFDGKFHNLKVKLVNGEHFSVQARRGYFSPKQAEDAATLEKEAMMQALFSGEEMKGIPVKISTKLFKADAQTAKVTVIVHTSLRSMRFRRQDGLNLNDLTVMIALFDRDGNYVAGQQKTIGLRLTDTMLAQLRVGGATISEELSAKPGSYLIRAVLRESESQQLGAGSQSVEIP
jgi:VWFA-related protein